MIRHWLLFLRGKMLELGSKEYEDLRYQFVESRRKNPDHPNQRRLWNGISEGMWTSQEGYEFLEKNGGREMLDKYHPEANEKVSSLDSFF